MNKKPPRPQPRLRGRYQRGTTLIESLVGILIFSIGIVGNLGLMAQMTRAQGGAQFKSQASMLSAEIVAVMWADSGANQVRYTTPGTCIAHDRCNEWTQKVARSLPGGTGAVQALGGGAVNVTIGWKIPGDGEHSYAVQTTIAR